MAGGENRLWHQRVEFDEAAAFVLSLPYLALAALSRVALPIGRWALRRAERLLEIIGRLTTDG